MAPKVQPPTADDSADPSHPTRGTTFLGYLRPRLLHWPIAIALLTVVGLYAGFAMQQYSRLNDLNQRELADAAAQLQRSLDNALETISRIRPTGGSMSAHAGKTRQEVEDASLCAFDRNQPYLEIVPPDACGQAVSGPLTVSMSDRKDEPLTLIATTPSGQRLAFKFLADVALGELPFPESFGLIFIADTGGRILYQDAPSTRVWLRHLRWGEQRFRDSAAAYQGHATLGQAMHVFGNAATGGWQRFSAMSGRTTLQLAGDDHAVYFEPITLEKAMHSSLVLGGAVSKRVLIRQALAVDSYFLALLVFLLLLSLLGLPFVKLLSLDAHERFDLRDVTRLHISTVALLALLTFSIEALNGYLRWNEEAGRGLEQLADRLAENVGAEVRAIQAVVARYDEDVSGLSPKALDARPPVTDWFASKPSSTQPALPGPEVHIENLSWIDPTGRQVWKVTADTIKAKQSGLSNRLYFRSVRDGHLFEMDGTSPFHVGPDRSVTNGKFYTFFSMPSRVGEGAANGRDGSVVVLATTRLMSLRAVPLPAGYGYALIDRTGRALYHSDTRLSLRENLFQEMGSGARARSIVYAGHASAMTGSYRERPHAFYVRPLALRLASDPESGAPGALAGLHIVTFRDTSLDMATVARTFLQALCGPGVLLIAIVTLAMGVMAFAAKRKEDHWSVWLWPNGLTHVYRTISGALGVVLLVSGLVALAGSARDIVLMGLPLVALTAAVTVYRRTARQVVPGTSRSTVWHSCMFLLLLVCTIVVPAAAVFRTALGHELGKRIATEQAWLTAQCVDLPRAIRSEVLAEGRPALMGDRLAATTAARCVRFDGADAIQPYSRPPAPLASITHWLLTPYHWADGLLPVNTDYEARVRYQEPANSDASHVASSLVPWGTRWGFVSYAVVLLALAWWMRRKAVLLFFADQTPQPPHATPAADVWAQCSPDERLVLAHVALDGIVNPYQRPVVEALLRRGALTLAPNLRPSNELRQFIEERREALRQELRESERVESSHSWRFARGVLVASAIGLAVFLFATQPALQSEFIGIASGVSGALATVMKLWDTFASRVVDQRTERGTSLVGTN